MIDPQNIEVGSLPSVPLENKADLPDISCIYFAIDSQGVIQYIGKTINLRQRWLRHHREEQLNNQGQCSIAYVQVPENLLSEVERALVSWFNPPLNGVLPSRSIAKSPMKDLRLRSGKRAEEVAAELGVSISTVRNWEQLRNAPRMTPMGLKRLMEIYKCSFDDLIQAEIEMSEA